MLSAISQFLHQEGYVARLADNLLGPHDFLANSDEQRLAQLQQALTAPDSDIVWCVRGGHGTTRLMPFLMDLLKPNKPKLVVGFSDITTLHLWLNQVWHWPSLHGPMARQVALGLSDTRDVEALLRLWRGDLANYCLTELLPLNDFAKHSPSLTGVTAGTCLSLLQTSLSTPWQLISKDKLVFIEDINEAAYKLDRLLVHLSNAGLWQQARAIILGDFGENFSISEQKQVHKVLQEFSHAQTVPVFSLKGFGHGPRNLPIPLGVKATIVSENGLWAVKF